MGLIEYKDELSSFASFSTIIQFLVPVWICKKYITDGTTGATSSLPFAVGLMSTCLWWKYGTLLGDPSLIGVNAVGSFLQFLYVAIFYSLCPKKLAVIQQLFGVCVVLLLTMVYTAWESNEQLILHRVGLLCCVMTVVFFAAPLSQLAYVIRVKNAESLPFILILMTFITSVEWFLYGIIIDDLFVQIPNILGCLLSSFQLSLFVIFPSPKNQHSPGAKYPGSIEAD